MMNSVDHTKSDFWCSCLLANKCIDESLPSEKPGRYPVTGWKECPNADEIDYIDGKQHM